MRADHIDQTIVEIDMKPVSSNATEIQNVLFDYCGINPINQLGEVKGAAGFSNQNRIERMFGKIRKLPKKSCLLGNFEDELYEPKNESEDKGLKKN